MDVCIVLDELKNFKGITLDDWEYKIKELYNQKKNKPINNYMTFRSEKLKGLKIENPKLTYKENLAIISKLWQEYKNDLNI
jgi:hypothetical protein